MDQEKHYLEALNGAATFSVDGTVMLVRTRAGDKPLRFVRTKP
jgi:heat shock protein HslJ